MKSKPTYEVWDAVAYGYGEPLVPFRQVGVFDTLQQVQTFAQIVKHLTQKKLYFANIVVKKPN